MTSCIRVGYLLSGCELLLIVRKALNNTSVLNLCRTSYELFQKGLIFCTRTRRICTRFICDVTNERSYITRMFQNLSTHTQKTNFANRKLQCKKGGLMLGRHNVVCAELGKPKAIRQAITGKPCKMFTRTLQMLNQNTPIEDVTGSTVTD